MQCEHHSTVLINRFQPNTNRLAARPVLSAEVQVQVKRDVHCFYPDASCYTKVTGRLNPPPHSLLSKIYLLSHKIKKVFLQCGKCLYTGFLVYVLPGGGGGISIHLKDMNKYFKATHFQKGKWLLSKQKWHISPTIMGEFYP